MPGFAQFRGRGVRRFLGGDGERPYPSWSHVVDEHLYEVFALVRSHRPRVDCRRYRSLALSWVRQGLSVARVAERILMLEEERHDEGQPAAAP